MRRRIGLALSLIGFTALIFAGLLAALHIVGTDSALYYTLQTQAGVTEYAGISDEDLQRLDGALADCLKGDADALTELRLPVFGVEQNAFNERELTHMEDCRRLFVLLRWALWISTGVGILCTVFGLRFLNKDPRRLRLAAYVAPALVYVPLGAFALWAAVSFDAAFTFFHEVLFTNDLWLLNPATDLLIRVCPSEMFMEMGGRILLLGLVWAAFVPVAVRRATLRKGKENEGLRSADARES